MVCSDIGFYSLSFISALSDPSSRLSTSPPPPAIAVPLLEMGFSLRQIAKAMEATGRIHFYISVYVAMRSLVLLRVIRFLETIRLFNSRFS